MTAIDFLWALAVCAAILVVPGMLLGWIIGLRGLWLYAASAPFSASVISFASLIAPLVGMSWSLVPVGAMTALLAIVLLVVRLVFRRFWSTGPTPSIRNSGRWAVVALAITGAVLVARVAQILYRPTDISQTFDNIFHLNAIRYVLDTGSASPLELGSLTSAEQWFYPATWHALGALVEQSAGGGVAMAANAVWVVLTVLVWPASILVLVRTMFGGRPAVLVSAAVAAAAVPAFPILMIDYGVLYPFHMSIALLPVALAATLEFFGLARHPSGLGRLVWAIVVLGALPGITLAHPGGFMAWLAVSLPIIVIAFVIAVRESPARRIVLLSIGFAIYLVIGVIAVRVLRPPSEASAWPTIGSAGQALGEVATVSLYHSVMAPIVAVMMIVGIVIAVRACRRADIVALAMFATAAGLYVVVAGSSFQALRSLLTAPWYNNTPRLAAILVVLIVPFAAAGGAWCWERFRALGIMQRPALVSSPALRWAVATAVVVLVVVLSQGRAMHDAMANARFSYTLSEESPLLSTDELALIEMIPDYVPESSTIVGSPWTGTSLAYALADRRVLMPHTLMDTRGDIDVINNGLDEAQDGDPVCRALEREHAEFVLDFGGREVHGDVHDYSGLDELATSTSVDMIASVGDARLYAITACR